MNLINSLVGILILVILIAIGYKVGQMVIELNSPITPVNVNTSKFTLPKEQPHAPVQPLTINMRWNHFPLTVYVNDNFVQQKNPEYVDDVRTALNRWQSTEIVSFSLVNTPENADVIIEWVPTLKEKALDTLGNTDLKFINITQFGIIQNATIELLTKSESRQLSSTDMVNLAMHEIGHAIGLQHTTEDDIMNPVLVVPSKAVKEISTSDINNLQELYETSTKSDLRIAGVNATKSTFKRFGQNYFYLNISINLQNVGLVTAENFTIQLAADNIVVNEDDHTLEPGNTLSIFQGNLRIDRNFTSIQVSIDPQNVIDELNETNNFINIPV